MHPLVAVDNGKAASLLSWTAATNGTAPPIISMAIATVGSPLTPAQARAIRAMVSLSCTHEVVPVVSEFVFIDIASSSPQIDRFVCLPAEAIKCDRTRRSAQNFGRNKPAGRVRKFGSVVEERVTIGSRKVQTTSPEQRREAAPQHPTSRRRTSAHCAGIPRNHRICVDPASKSADRLTFKRGVP